MPDAGAALVSPRLDPLPPEAACRPGGLPSGCRVQVWDEARPCEGGASEAFVALTFRTRHRQLVCGPCFAAADTPMGLGWTSADLAREFAVWADCRGLRPPAPHEPALPAPEELAQAKPDFLADVDRVNRVVLRASGDRSALISRGVFLRFGEHAAWRAFLEGGTPALDEMFQRIYRLLPAVPMTPARAS